MSSSGTLRFLPADSQKNKINDSCESLPLTHRLDLGLVPLTFSQGPSPKRRSFLGMDVMLID